MGKLWSKGYSIDELMEKFTVGNDYLLDKELVLSDCVGSLAHAHTIAKAGIITQEELSRLYKALKSIIDAQLRGEFEITLSDEDCHTAIEGYLTKLTKDAGKKIHTGRSRNDQVQTALRLWMREFSLRFAYETLHLASLLFQFAQEHEWVPMPGRTHMQLAMPSSVGLWAASFGEELADEAMHMVNIGNLLDQSPLGAAASYGTSLPLDRTYSASLMGFAKVQHNVLYANNSRGKFEAILLDGCDYITLTLSKLAQDLMLFSLSEFGYFSLPKELCTGSSIMPQKRNPDGLELTRSKSAIVSSCSERVKSIIRSLPSGYNRDFQDTKEPLLTGTQTAYLTVQIIKRMIGNVTVHPENLIAGCTKELYATDEVLKRIIAKGNFRDMYKEVGTNLESIEEYDPQKVIKERTSEGTTGALALEERQQIVQENLQLCSEKLEKLRNTYRNLAQTELSLVSY